VLFWLKKAASVWRQIKPDGIDGNFSAMLA